jgi:riboflavin kinase/FMN adenylyltransferase
MKFTGTVVHGKQLGRTIGFPTANILPDGPVDAQNGVYVGEIIVEGVEKPMRCMVNQGVHPTVPDGPPTIEAHILDFADDIYDRRAEVEYLRFLRPEQKFPSLDALKNQL